MLINKKISVYASFTPQELAKSFVDSHNWVQAQIIHNIVCLFDSWEREARHYQWCCIGELLAKCKNRDRVVNFLECLLDYIKYYTKEQSNE